MSCFLSDSVLSVSVVKENAWIFTWKLPASTEKLCARIRSEFNL